MYLHLCNHTYNSVYSLFTYISVEFMSSNMTAFWYNDSNYFKLVVVSVCQDCHDKSLSIRYFFLRLRLGYSIHS